jgi:succinate dehydrogenase / fumarate reductase flavoprotein subunit
VWEHKGEPKDAVRHQEQLHFENVHLAVRSYK